MSAMTARQWVQNLAVRGTITQRQAASLLSRHCTVMGSDGKSYSLGFDPKLRPSRLDAPIAAGKPKKVTSARVCPACGGRATKIVRASREEKLYLCQQCGHEYDPPTRKDVPK